MRLKIYTSEKETKHPKLFALWTRWLSDKKSDEVEYNVWEGELDKMPSPKFIEGNSKIIWHTIVEAEALKSLKKEFEEYQGDTVFL